MQMLEKIKFNNDDQLFILGDIIDRGDNPLDIIKHVMSHDNITMLLGNHEQMMLDYFDTRDDLWFYNGGRVTFSQLLPRGENEIRHIINWISRRETHCTVRLKNVNYRLVHAGLEYNPFTGELLNPQNKDYMIWARNDFLVDQKVPAGDVVIFGHTPTPYIHGNSKIWYGENKICIDCGAFFTGVLGCIRLDDMQAFYVGLE
jgi:serine/threonine protein phosphatase 1